MVRADKFKSKKLNYEFYTESAVQHFCGLDYGVEYATVSGRLVRVHFLATRSGHAASLFRAECGSRSFAKQPFTAGRDVGLFQAY